VLLLPTMFAGCVSSGEPPVQRELPAVPAFARPVAVPDPRPGEPALAVAARERAGRLQANRVITGFRGWYEQVLAGYAGKETGR
jgi:hypothetical protein